MIPSKRSEAEEELINEFKTFDLCRKSSDEVVRPSRFKVSNSTSATGAEGVAGDTGSTRSTGAAAAKPPKPFASKKPLPKNKPPPPPPVPMPSQRMPDIVQTVSKVISFNVLKRK